MLARSRWFRRCAAPLGLALWACGGEGATDPPRVPAAIAMVSGNDQEGAAGAGLAPFAVRVTDALGDGVGGVRVAWRIASGAGELGVDPGLPSWLPSGRQPDGRLFTTTGFTGNTWILFRPTVLGTSTVAAEVDGIQGSPVVFATHATRLVISFGPGGNCPAADASFFRGPDGSSDVTVPVGTTVEWWGWGVGMEWFPVGCHQGARILSAREPPGGERFDSGVLTLDDSFEFTPGVAGTWEYVDQVSGGTGTLTAQ